MLEDLDELCRELRVIHSLRRNVGMSMTVLQYEDIGSLCVVSRVALWSMHGVALQMCRLIISSINHQNLMMVMLLSQRKG